MSSSNLIRIFLIIFAVLYCVSPIDLCPGPLDDLIVVIVDLVCQKALNEN